MSTPRAKPQIAPNVLDYAPRHVRERVDTRPAAPDPSSRDERPADEEAQYEKARNEKAQYEGPHHEGTHYEEERHEASLIPDSPPRPPIDDAPRPIDLDEAAGLIRDAEPANDRNVPRADAPAPRLMRNAAAEAKRDEDIAQLAALLENIRRGDGAETPQTPPPLRRRGELPPLGSVRPPEVYIEGLRVPRSLAPSYVAPPPQLERGHGRLKAFAGIAAASFVAAVIAYFIVGNWHGSASKEIAPSASLQARENGATTAAAAEDQPAAPEARRGARLASTPAPYTVASATPAAEASNAAPPQKPAPMPAAIPPAQAAPVTRLAPWPGTPSVSAPPPAPAPVTAPAPAAAPAPASLAPPPPPRPAMDAQEIKLLLEQGKQFTAVGDLVTARTVLQRVADADVADGALALAETYDPAVLAKLGVRGVTGDIEKARRWYERAQQLGSDEAGRRLAPMARR